MVCACGWEWEFTFAFAFECIYVGREKEMMKKDFVIRLLFILQDVLFKGNRSKLTSISKDAPS